MDWRSLAQRPDVVALAKGIEANPVLAALGLMAVTFAVPRVLRRMFPMTRADASRLSPRYRRALARGGKRPRGLKFKGAL